MSVHSQKTDSSWWLELADFRSQIRFSPESTQRAVARMAPATISGEVFAVNVNWNANDSKWNVNANPLNDNRWNAGNHVISLATADVSPTL